MVSCQPAATPIKLDQNATHKSAGMRCLLCGANLIVNELDLPKFRDYRFNEESDR
jgi:hypothetical protein